MTASFKFPAYIKAPLLFIGLYFFVMILYTAQDVILPLIYACLFAVLLSTPVNFLVKKGVNRAFSISAVLIIAAIVSVAIILLIASQTNLLKAAWPHLINELKILVSEAIIWASAYFNISAFNLDNWIAEIKTDLLHSRNAALGITLTTMGGVLTAAFLTPVYIFMILFYQSHLLEFAHKVFGTDRDDKVSEILTGTKTIIRSYLIGLFVEFVIIATLNSAGLLVLRMDYAILLGIIGAVLNVIPLVGGVVCVLLFMAVALITKSPVYVLYVVALYGVIQTIDNHFIVPKIIGGKVKLNALICLIAVIAGDALWGIPGMFLSIPLTAIVKLVFDKIDPLKPLGFLMGGMVQVIKNK